MLEEDQASKRTAEDFPLHEYDEYVQQKDNRKVNTWVMPLDAVTSTEFLEVQAVNVTAPFVMNARLMPLLQRAAASHGSAFVVNVSALEGQFYRRHKTQHHPHTNMAKAAINMMTRTCAQALALEHIYMNSVDTGWINDELPLEKAEFRQVEYGFKPPLDEIDAAARILDPIFVALNDANFLYGLFLKDYRPIYW